MKSQRELIAKKREWEEKIRVVESNWETVCDRDRTRDIAALQARVTELRSKVVEASEAGETAVVLDDQLLAAREDHVLAADRLARIEGTRSEKQAELSALQRRLDEAGSAVDVVAAGSDDGGGGGDSDSDDGGPARLGPDELALVARLERQRISLVRILETQEAEAAELQTRVDVQRAEVTQLRDTLDAIVGDDDSDLNTPSTHLGSTTPATTPMRADDDSSLIRLHRMLLLLRHTKEAEFNSIKQGETMHALRAELNRAKLDMGAHPHGPPGSRSLGGSPASYSGQSPRGSSGDGGVLRDSRPVSSGHRPRGQSIIWKPPPKPPRPAASGSSTATRQRFDTMS